jgi:hypothetical protein
MGGVSKMDGLWIPFISQPIKLPLSYHTHHHHHHHHHRRRRRRRRT